MDEPRRDRQIGIKLSAVEEAELKSAAASADMQPAAWCRAMLLEAARGERAKTNIEVPRGDMDGLHISMERAIKLLLVLLEDFYAHTHHGDPRSEHEDPNARALGRKRAERKMRETMTRLGLDGQTSR